MLGLVLKTLFICVFVNFYAKASIHEDLKQEFVDVLVECAEKFPLTAEELEQLKKDKMADTENVKCMFACAYKKTGMMTEKGELSIDGVKKLSEKYYSNDPEKLKKAAEFAEACKSVNEQAVSDGEKGCERAGLIFQCSVSKAAEFDFSE